MTCGCVVYRVTPQAKGLDVATILSEENTSVRAAMLKIFGVEKFFAEANPKVLDTVGDYTLLEVSLGGQGWREEKLHGLRMVCPSTKETHFHAVPPREVFTVAGALNWIYSMPEGVNYLDSIAVES